ncbi:MAG: hypothetical protein FJ221_07520 [Lentisphaerae bacterium]|nr:hypothetical protein [Lentisphaerota bacterium]
MIVGFLGNGLLSSAGSCRLDAVRRQQSLQCFWGAESALALARTRLYTDESYRSSPTAIVLTNGLMVAHASVSRAGNTYVVSATGSNTHSRIDWRLRQDFTLQSLGFWDDFALFAGPGGIDMSQSVSVYGDVYCEGDLRMSQSAAIFESLYCRGDLEMSHSAAIYEEAYIGGRISMSRTSVVYGGSYPFSSPANPYEILSPTVPTLDTSFYDSLLRLAASSDSGLNFNSSIDLAGQTRYVSGNASLKMSQSIVSRPPGGVLVVAGSFDMKQNSQIGPDVTVICGDGFSMGQNTRIGTNALIYAAGGIDMRQSGIVANRAALLTPATLTMRHAAQASGLVYAGRTLDLSQGIVIEGLAYAGSRADLSQSVRITYNKTVLPWSLPPGIATNGAVQMLPQQWREM